MSETVTVTTVDHTVTITEGSTQTVSITPAAAQSISVTAVYGGGGGGGGDSDDGGSDGGGVQERDYSKNLDIMAEDMISGRTSIMILGDSINNPLSTYPPAQGVGGFMKDGYLAKWEPQYWRGVSVGLTGGNRYPNLGFLTGAVGGQVSGINQSGSPDPTRTDVAASGHGGKAVQNNAYLAFANKLTSDFNNGLKSNYRTYNFNDVLEDAIRWQGSVQPQPMWRGTQMQYTVLLYSSTAETIEVWWRWGGGAGSPTTQIRQYTLSAGFNTITSPVADNTLGTAGGGNVEFYSLGLENQTVSIINFIIEDLSAAGMAMSYMGGGGWKTASHRYGDTNAPGAGTNTGGSSDGTIPGRPAYYEDAAAQANLNMAATDIVMIQMGANDGDVSGVTDHLTGVIERFRALKPGMKFLLISQYNVNGDAQQVTRWNAQSQYMRSLAGSSGYEDVAFIDLNLKVFDKHGPYSTWQNDFIPDGIHPNRVGAEEFAELEWDIIKDSAEADTGLASWRTKGSSSLTTVGTITTWSGNTISVSHGGTSATTAAAARTSLGVTNAGSYTGQVETAADKTYTLDPGAVSARTITGFYIKSASGTCTANLKVGSNVVKAASVTSSTGDQTSLANTAVAIDDVITLVVSSNSSAVDVIFSVEYTE